MNLNIERGKKGEVGGLTVSEFQFQRLHFSKHQLQILEKVTVLYFFFFFVKVHAIVFPLYKF